MNICGLSVPTNGNASCMVLVWIVSGTDSGASTSGSVATALVTALVSVEKGISATMLAMGGARGVDRLVSTRTKGGNTTAGLAFGEAGNSKRKGAGPTAGK